MPFHVDCDHCGDEAGAGGWVQVSFPTHTNPDYHFCSMYCVGQWVSAHMDFDERRPFEADDELVGG